MDSSYYAPGAAGAPAGPTALNDLSDVAVPTPSDGDALVYDSSLGIWVADQIEGGNGGPAYEPLGAFEEQTPTPGSYHFPRGGTFGQESPFGATLVPIIFTENTTITKLGTRVTFNVPQQFGGDPNGMKVWQALYEAGEDGLPETLVAGSDKTIVVGQGEGTPEGAFDSFSGALIYDLPTPVTLTAGTRYWVGIIGAPVGEPAGNLPQLLSYEPIGIGPNLTGGTGVPDFLFDFFPSIGSVWIQGALETAEFDFDTDPLPATLPTGMIGPHGPGCTAGVLVQGI